LFFRRGKQGPHD